MDEIDMAQARMEQELAERIRSRVRYEGESLHKCVNCGEPIPEARRRAVPGCMLCVACQEAAECL